MKFETAITRVKDPVERLFAFARKRHQIYLDKLSGVRPPYTEDPILRDYRFCCVYRELDRVTRWIQLNYGAAHEENPDMWFAMCVARLLNQPKSLEVIGYPVPWSPTKFLLRLKRFKDADPENNKIFNAAYIVSAPGGSKIEYLANDVLTPLWEQRQRMRPKPGDTLNSYHMLLGQMQGFGSFMTAQVIADLKYHEPLNQASDWETFAASGPGSRRGLNYVMGYERDDPWTEEEWRLELGRLREKLLPMFRDRNMEQPHAQDMQNLLCEWSKYWRAATTGHMPKQKYRWKQETTK